MQLATANRRRLFFALLYFNEGAPIGLIWLALPAILRTDGVPVEQIGSLLALAVLPWTLKFVAGPLVDSLSMVRGGSRALLMATQAGMASTMLIAAGYSGPDDLSWLGWALVAHALCAALQDVTIDAMAIRLTTAPERGRLNAAMQLGLYGGRSLFAGLALGAIGGLAWHEACRALAAIQALTILVVALTNVPTPAGHEKAAGGVVREALRAALARRSTWVGLAFAAFAGAGYEATAALAGPWLVDRGVATADLGRWQLIGVPLMIVLGSQIGGVVADWRGHRMTAALGLVGFVAAIGCLAAWELSIQGGARGMPAWIALGAMYCAVGVFTVGSYALFMDLTDARIGGTQFSAFMAGTNACEAWSLALGGWLAASAGYAGSVMVLSLVSLACLPLLLAMRPEQTCERIA